MQLFATHHFGSGTSIPFCSAAPPGGMNTRHFPTRAHIENADPMGPSVPAIKGNAVLANHQRLSCKISTLETWHNCIIVGPTRGSLTLDSGKLVHPLPPRSAPRCFASRHPEHHLLWVRLILDHSLLTSTSVEYMSSDGLDTCLTKGLLEKWEK